MGKWNIKTWLTSLVGREMQIKTSARGQCIHTGLDIIKKNDNTNCWGGSEEAGTLPYMFHVGIQIIGAAFKKFDSFLEFKVHL